MPIKLKRSVFVFIKGRKRSQFISSVCSLIILHGWSGSVKLCHADIIRFIVLWVHKGKLWFGSSFALDFQQTRCLAATLTIPIETTSTNSNASMGQPHLCFCKRAMCFKAWSVLEIHSNNLKRWLQLLCLLREILYSHLFTLPSKIQISYIKDNQLIVPQPDCYDPPYSNPSQNACESMTNVAETWPHFKGLVSRGQILIRIRFSVNSFRVFWYTVAWLLFLKHLFLDTAASLWCPCSYSHFHILRHTVLTVNQRCYARRGESGIVKTHFTPKSDADTYGGPPP